MEIPLKIKLSYLILSALPGASLFRFSIKPNNNNNNNNNNTNNNTNNNNNNNNNYNTNNNNLLLGSSITNVVYIGGPNTR